jgi:hypothetical protein
MPLVTTVTVSVAAAATEGIDGMVRVPFPFAVKQPLVWPVAHGSRTDGVPACCWLVVPT